MDHTIPITQHSQIFERVEAILKRGNDVEIRSCKEGYKVIEVIRRASVVLTK